MTTLLTDEMRAATRQVHDISDKCVFCCSFTMQCCYLRARWLR